MAIENGTYKKRVELFESLLDLVNGLPRKSVAFAVHPPKYMKAQSSLVGFQGSTLFTTDSRIGAETMSPETLTFIYRGTGWPTLETNYQRVEFLAQARNVIEALLTYPEEQIIIPAPAVFGADDRGFIVSESPLVEMLAGIRRDRIRQCSICSGVFYAHRELSKGCRGRCASTLRKQHQRKLLKENAAKYEAKRIGDARPIHSGRNRNR